MFWILQIFPSWLWWLLLVAGLSGYFLAQLIPVKTYQLPIKTICGMLVVAVIFIMGIVYADSRWQQAARELQAQVKVAEAKSQQVNEVVREKIVTQTKVVKQRGETVVKYIDREVVKLDETCVIPPEFVSAHNQAAAK